VVELAVVGNQVVVVDHKHLVDRTGLVVGVVGAVEDTLVVVVVVVVGRRWVVRTH